MNDQMLSPFDAAGACRVFRRCKKKKPQTPAASKADRANHSHHFVSAFASNVGNGIDPGMMVMK